MLLYFLIGGSRGVSDMAPHFFFTIRNTKSHEMKYTDKLSGDMTQCQKSTDKCSLAQNLYIIGINKYDSN